MLTNDSLDNNENNLLNQSSSSHDDINNNQLDTRTIRVNSKPTVSSRLLPETHDTNNNNNYNNTNNKYVKNTTNSPNYGSINDYEIPKQHQEKEFSPGDQSIDQSLSISVRDDQYALYTQRWLILFAITMFSLIGGLERSCLSVIDIVYKHIGTDVYRYTQWQPLSMLVLLFFGVPLSRALDRYGLRVMAYFACSTTMLAHLFISLSLMPDDHVLSIPKRFRFGFIIAGNVAVQFVIATNICFPAKVAPTWFAEVEATRVMMIWGSGYSIAAGLTNHYVPEIVEREDELDIIAYIYLTIGVFVCLATIFLIRRSIPEKPPSCKAHESNEDGQAPLFKSLYVILTCPQYVLVLFTATVNNATLNLLFSVLEHVFKESGYSNQFCGNMISMFFLLGIPASFLSAFLVDKSGHFVAASKVAAFVHPMFFLGFSLAIQYPGQPATIVGFCFLISISMGLIVQSLIQVQLRASSGIIAGSSVMAMSNIILALVTTLMCSIFEPLSNLSPVGHRSVIPLNAFALFNVSTNFFYLIFYRMPNKVELRRKMHKNCDKIQINQDNVEDRFRYVEQI